MNKDSKLLAPSAAAKELKISVATLRKYSLIVEKIANNANYYERTKQKARLYSQKNIDDLKAFHNLSHTRGMTLKEAAQQIFGITDKKQEDQKKQAAAEKKQAEALLDTHQVVKLLTALQQTIASQNQAITKLQNQLNDIQGQNKMLLDEQKKLAAPSQELPDISGIVDVDEPEMPKTKEEKRAEVKKDFDKSEDQVRGEILQKSQENAAKRARENVHRTLADMQIPKKKHWWDIFFH